MWTIVAGENQLACGTILEETVNRSGVALKGAKVYFPEGITRGQMDALLENPWSVYDESGTLLGVHSGYGEALDCCVTFLKIGEGDRLALQLEAVTQELARKTRELQGREALLDSVARVMAEAGVTLEGLTREAERKRGLLERSNDSENAKEAQQP